MFCCVIVPIGFFEIKKLFELERLLCIFIIDLNISESVELPIQ